MVALFDVNRNFGSKNGEKSNEEFAEAKPDEKDAPQLDDFRFGIDCRN